MGHPNEHRPSEFLLECHWAHFLFTLVRRVGRVQLRSIEANTGDGSHSGHLASSHRPREEHCRCSCETCRNDEPISAPAADDAPLASIRNLNVYTVSEFSTKTFASVTSQVNAVDLYPVVRRKAAYQLQPRSERYCRPEEKNTGGTKVVGACLGALATRIRLPHSTYLRRSKLCVFSGLSF